MRLPLSLMRAHAPSAAPPVTPPSPASGARLGPPSAAAMPANQSQVGALRGPRRPGGPAAIGKAARAPPRARLPPTPPPQSSEKYFDALYEYR